MRAFFSQDLDRMTALALNMRPKMSMDCLKRLDFLSILFSFSALYYYGSSIIITCFEKYIYGTRIIPLNRYPKYGYLRCHSRYQQTNS